MGIISLILLLSDSDIVSVAGATDLKLLIDKRDHVDKAQSK